MMTWTHGSVMATARPKPNEQVAGHAFTCRLDSKYIFVLHFDWLGILLKG